jgi:hypothetical protein
MAKNKYITIEAGTASKVFNDAASVIEYAKDLVSGKTFEESIKGSIVSMDSSGATIRTDSCTYEYGSPLLYPATVPQSSVLIYPTYVGNHYCQFEYNKETSQYECIVDVPGFDNTNLNLTYDRISRSISLSGQVKNRYVNVMLTVPQDLDLDLTAATVSKGQIIIKAPKVSPEQIKLERAIPVKIS